MWLTAINGDRIKIYRPDQIRRVWPPGYCESERPVVVPGGFQIAVHTGLAYFYGETEFPESVELVMEAHDTEDSMNESYRKLCQKVNANFYIPLTPPDTSEKSSNET